MIHRNGFVYRKVVKQMEKTLNKINDVMCNIENEEK